MRKINIVSRKYDGSLRDEHEAFVYSESEERLVAYAPPGTPEYDHRKHAWSPAPDGILEFYFKTKWYSDAPAVHAQVQAACAEVEALYYARACPFNFDEQVALYVRIKAGQQ